MPVRPEAEGPYCTVLHFHSEETLVHADVVDGDLARGKADADYINGGGLRKGCNRYGGAVLAA